jgi:hypothetical protein
MTTTEAAIASERPRRSPYPLAPGLSSIGLIPSPARVGRSGCLNPPQPLRVDTARPLLVWRLSCG